MHPENNADPVRLAPTVGVDWEVWITRPNGRLVPEKPALAAMVERLRDRAPELPVGLDFQQLELRSGVAESAADLQARVRKAYGLARRDARRRGRRVYPGASHPGCANFCGGHVHVGPFFDCREAERTKLALLPWVAGLVALSVASPERVGEHGRYRSYRVATGAGGCLRPLAVQRPGSTFPVWGEDLCVKAQWKPTLEVRLFDGAVCPEVFGQLATLAAGLVLSVRDAVRDRSSTQAAAPPELPSESEHREALANRYNAARFGLQAAFRRGGRTVTASAFVRDLLVAAEPGLAQLGTRAEDLTILQTMVRCRVTQADWLSFAMAGSQGAARAVQLLSVRDAQPFRAWLAALDSQPRSAGKRASAPHVEPLAALPGLCRGLRPWADIAAELCLPPAVVLDGLEALAARGAVRLVRDRMRGLLVEGAAAEGRAVEDLAAEDWAAEDWAAGELVAEPPLIAGDWVRDQDPEIVRRPDSRAGGTPKPGERRAPKRREEADHDAA